MLSYDNTYPVGPTQMRSSVKGRLTTADFYLDRGQRGSLGFTQGLKYTVPESRWILGVLGDVDLYVFDREYERRDGRVSNYYLMFIPSIEYKILDTLNFRTSVAYAFANQRLKGSWLKWEDQAPTARAGFGWAITRSIYFNPFLNFFAERPAVHTTSLSFSTVFSIF